MLYISTRGNIEPQSSAQAISLGMVPAGGLFVPQEIPVVDWQELQGLDYHELALFIMRLFCNDLPDSALQQAVKVYGDGHFDNPNPAPLVDIDGCGLLELWHGPTAAFKDMALQVLPYLLAASIKAVGLDAEVLILTATSGDTGKAALEGFKDAPATKIVVFYPDGGVSPVQERQMITTGGSNTYVVAVSGNFDQCQTAVKRVFSSQDLREKLFNNKKVFSSANSINWGRLLPQIVYYFWAYLQAVKQGKVESGSPINVVVPTGNFGNILAAFYAKKMGLPIQKLICASNRNNVLSDFFQTGIYNSNRPFYLTSSPSMDILISSNFERFLFEMTGRDAMRINKWFKALGTEGSYQVEDPILKTCRQNMYAGWASEEDVNQTIAAFFREYGYVLDPHTAVGVKVYQDYKQQSADNSYTIIASTASPFKFAQSVLEAIQPGQGAKEDAWGSLNKLSDLTGWQIPSGLRNLQDKEAQPVRKCLPTEIENFILEQFC